MINAKRHYHFFLFMAAKKYHHDMISQINESEVAKWFLKERISKLSNPNKYLT